MRVFLLILTYGLVLSSGVIAKNSGKEAKPNFLFLLVDDLGWADLACYGSTFHETPHLDRLARGRSFYRCLHGSINMLTNPGLSYDRQASGPGQYH